MRCDRIITEGDISFATIGTDELTQLVFGFSKHDMSKYLVSIE
jgi:phosphoenolpyruvate synthase/pyruvate phosphate dikinase